jgi:hypothetical protein
MKKILIGSGIAVIIIGAFLLFSDSNSEVKNPLQSSQPISQKKKEIKNNEIITNTVAKININESKEKTTKNKYSNSENQANNVANNNSYFDKENNEYVFDKKSFDNFADNNNLEEVGNIDDNTKIYAKNPPVRNDFAPPMPPVLIKVKFKNDTKIVPLNSNIANANKKIYVAKKSDNKVEVKEIDTKDISSFAPPAIGQN